MRERKKIGQTHKKAREQMGLRWQETLFTAGTYVYTEQTFVSGWNCWDSFKSDIGCNVCNALHTKISIFFLIYYLTTHKASCFAPLISYYR